MIRHDVELTTVNGRDCGWYCHTCGRLQPNTLTGYRADQEGYAHAKKGRWDT